LGNDVRPGTGQTDGDGLGEAHETYTLILKAFVGAVLHLGLPGSGLCTLCDINLQVRLRAPLLIWVLFFWGGAVNGQ
jgi:hypothetical protein